MTMNLLQFFAIATYLGGALLFARRLVIEGSDKLPIAYGLGALGLLAHATVLVSQVNAAAGLNLNFFITVSVFAWLSAGLFLVFAFRNQIENLGIFILPIAAIGVLLSAVFAQQSATIIQGDWGLKIHVIISATAYSIFMIATFQAILFALLEKRLHQKRISRLVRLLPPLQAMEALLFQLLQLGWLLLIGSVVTGLVFLDDIFAQHLVHKTVLSFAAIALFSVLLYGRYRYGWRGQTAVRWTISGFALLMLAYFGSKFVLEMILKR